MPEEISEPKLVLPSDRPPLFVSAGIIKKEYQISLYANVPEIAVQVIGDFSDDENAPPEPGPIFHYDDTNQAAYNAFRLRNPGHKEAGRYLPDGIKRAHEAGQLAIVGVVALENEDPLATLPYLAHWARETGADGVEVNVSCPNHGEELICSNANQTLEIFEAVRKAVGDDCYLIAKFSAMNQRAIREYKKNGLRVDGIAAINGPKTLSPLDPETNDHVIAVNNGYAGQSGPIISDLAVENLRDWLRPVTGKADFPVIDSQYDIWSVGGIEDGYEGYRRVHALGAFAFGGAQAFYRAAHPALVAKPLAREYTEAAESA